MGTVAETGITGKRRVARRLPSTCLAGVLVLGLSYGSSVTAVAGGTWAGSPEPRAHSASSAVPDLTGTWENVKNTHGSPPWQLVASNGLKNLEAHWHGGPGYHEHLSGEFHGTLSPDGTYYEGPYSISEETPHPSTGTAKFTIQTSNRIKVDIGTESIVFTRLGAAPSPSPTGVTPISTPPPIGKTTLYEAPAAGADQSYSLPKIAKKARDLEGQIGFVDNQGHPVAGPDAAARGAQTERASEVCLIFVLGGGSVKEKREAGEAFGVELPSLATCVDAVSRVLARADEIKRAKGARVSSSARTCAVLVRGKGRAHSPLRMSCKPTATGVSITIHPRSSNQTLAAALHGHAPKLIIGRSAVTPRPAGLRLSELWQARGKR